MPGRDSNKSLTRVITLNSLTFKYFIHVFMVYGFMFTQESLFKYGLMLARSAEIALQCMLTQSACACTGVCERK